LRKLAFAGLGIVAALALPTTALAAQQNTYSVQAAVSKANAVKFDYSVGESTGLKPAAVSRYTIAFGGLQSHGAKFKTCAATQMMGTDTGCNKAALLGKGTLGAFVYADNDLTGANGGFPCKQTLHVWNAGANKAVLFIGSDGSQCGGVGNLPAIPAKFVKSGNGQALQFDVPKTVLHPIGGLTVAVTKVSSTISKPGFFSATAKKHPVQVTFVTEAGQKSIAKA
jgi:hypothetical protein